MRINTLLKAVMVVVPLTFVAGCTTTPTADPVETPVTKVDDDTQSTTVVESVEPITTSEVDPVAQLEAKLRQSRVIYFEFDQSTIRAEYVDILTAHANFLTRMNNVTIRLEGHADERGTPEYNIALGERRAKAVADFLISSGVASERIEVISYGEERPAALGHNDSAWNKNRRVELKY